MLEDSSFVDEEDVCAGVTRDGREFANDGSDDDDADDGRLLAEPVPAPALALAPALAPATALRRTGSIKVFMQSSFKRILGSVFGGKSKLFDFVILLI